MMTLNELKKELFETTRRASEIARRLKRTTADAEYTAKLESELDTLWGYENLLLDEIDAITA